MIMTKQEAKTAVSRLRKVLRDLEQPVQELSHSRVCEMLAQALGYKNWSALEPHLSDVSEDSGREMKPTQSEGPVPGAKVWLATYEHRHGTDHRIFSAEAGALAWRWEIADEWWSTELPDEPRPADEALAEAYFAAMAEAFEHGETFSIEEMLIETAEPAVAAPPAERAEIEPSCPVIRFGEPPLSLEALERMPAYCKVAIVEVEPTHFYDRPFIRDNIDRDWLLGECLQRMTGSPQGLCRVRLEEVSIPSATAGCLAYRVQGLEVDYEAIERDLKPPVL